MSIFSKIADEISVFLNDHLFEKHTVRDVTKNMDMQGACAKHPYPDNFLDKLSNGEIKKEKVRI